MEESKPMSQQQQQQQQQQHHQFLLQQLQKHQLQAQGQQQHQHQQHQQQQQQQRQQQMLLLQQLQKQQQQQAAISRFPSNIDAHLRPPGFIPNRPVNLPQQNFNPNPNTSPSPSLTQQSPNLQQPNQQISQQQKAVRPLNHLELQFAYQDAWRVCHPDFKRPFSSLEDACERLLPYHVVADYEAEEDDRILDSDTTGQALSRSQQWDNNIAAKVAEFTATFEKQVLAFNIISRKRMAGEFRSEERLMIEQALLQEEKKALFELRAELESREKAGREAHEAKLRTAAMAQAGQIGTGTHAHAEIMARNPLRANALGNQGNNITLGHHEMGEQGQSMNPDEMMNGWGSSTQRDEDPSDDFLNDEENDNGEMGEQENSREGGEFDLNTH